MKLYIGGPMTDIPEFNFPLFDEVAEALRAQNYEIISPAEHDREVFQTVGAPGYAEGNVPVWSEAVGFDYETALAWDFAAVEQCDGIALLPGWSRSSGAKREKVHAEETGKSVYYAVPVWGTERWLLLTTPMQDDVLHAVEIQAPTVEEQLEPYDNHDIVIGPMRIHQGPAPHQGMIRGVGSFVTKDSGQRVAFDSGMVRDTQEGKPRYDLIPLMPLRRLAELYARGAEKYGARNWEQACTSAELDRFKASAFRHLVQALAGERDEDHWAAVVFNAFAAIWLEDKLA